MKWYLQTGKDSDVVINTKIIYSRNLRNYNFKTKNIKEIQDIEDEIKLKLPSIGCNLNFIKVKDISQLERESLFENSLISEEVLKNENESHSIIINEDEDICIMINEENHLVMQFFNAGMELENNFNFAKEFDKTINNELDIAKNKKYGYLTTSLIDLGTGLNAVVKMHLPGLTKTGNIRKVAQTVNEFGMYLSGVYIKDSSVIGDLYEIYNKQTLGILEDDIIKNLRIIVEKIIEQERLARQLLGKNTIELEDKVYRSYGTLLNCRKIKMEEAVELLSDVKLGCDMGIIKEIKDNQIPKIYTNIKPANLQIFFGEELCGYDRDIKRAEIIRKQI